MREVVYISIPMTGHDMEMQRKKAKALETYLKGKGFEVVNPFEISDLVENIHERYGLPAPTYDNYLDFDLYHIETRCHSIFVCKGWQSSNGCTKEVVRAVELNRKVYHESTFTY